MSARITCVLHIDMYYAQAEFHIGQNLVPGVKFNSVYALL